MNSHNDVRMCDAYILNVSYKSNNAVCTAHLIWFYFNYVTLFSLRDKMIERIPCWLLFGINLVLCVHQTFNTNAKTISQNHLKFAINLCVFVCHEVILRNLAQNLILRKFTVPQ